MADRVTAKTPAPVGDVEEDDPPRRRRGPDPDEPVSAGRKAGGFVREVAIVVIGALIVSALLRAFVGQMFYIPSGSMENTLQVDDRVWVQKITHFQRGDIVVFADPGNWLPYGIPTRTVTRQVLEFVGVLPATDKNYLIKRVIGMPGDVVQCCDDQGRILVNGYPLDEKSYLYTGADGQVDPSSVAFRVVVPADRIFVMGDHRNDSEDSRCHLADQRPGEMMGMNAFVPIADVVGSAVAVVAPLSRLHQLSRPATFSGVPPPSQPAPAEPTIEPVGVTC